MDTPSFSDYDIQSQFLQFLRDNDMYPIDNDNLILDGKLHRYRLEGDRAGETSGAYCVYTDGIPAGWAEDWHVGHTINWRYNTSGLQKEQIEYFNTPERKKKAEEARKKREAEQAARRAAASDRARIRIETLPDAPENHPYLQAKRVFPYGAKQDTEGKLAIPLRDVDGNIKSLQHIHPNGDKRLYLGAPAEGNFWSIGLDTITPNDTDTVILIGEGFATMAKVYELTELPCVAAISCSNMKSVAQALKGKYTNSKIICMADNDKATELKRGRNPGLDCANELVNLGLAHAVIYPDFSPDNDGTDWDDYALKFGDETTSTMLKEKIRWECLSDAEKKEVIARKELSEIATTLDRNIQIPPEDFIGGMFPRKRISAVIAAPGTGKTWFLQRFVSDLSVGGLILEGFAEEGSPKRSLVFAGEAGPALMIRRATDTKWPVNIQNVNIYGMIDAEKKGLSLMLDEDEGQENIERAIKMHRPDIVWFDTLSSFHNRDENKSLEMKPIFRWLLTIAEVYNIAIVLMHHSRKRLAKERKLALTQDDVIGSSIFNRLVSVIVSIEPTEDDNKKLMVRSLKSWFPEFMPFTYKLAEGQYEQTIMEVDLVPETVASSKSELWERLRTHFSPDEWFKTSDLTQEIIGDSISTRQLRRLLNDFVNSKKIKKRGSLKTTEYAVIGFYDTDS